MGFSKFFIQEQKQSKKNKNSIWHQTLIKEIVIWQRHLISTRLLYLSSDGDNYKKKRDKTNGIWDNILKY